MQFKVLVNLAILVLLQFDLVDQVVKSLLKISGDSTESKFEYVHNIFVFQWHFTHVHVVDLIVEHLESQVRCKHLCLASKIKLNHDLLEASKHGLSDLLIDLMQITVHLQRVSCLKEDPIIKFVVHAN